MAEQTGSQTAGLHLVVPLEQRLDLGASDAVQGELFVDEGATVVEARMYRITPHSSDDDDRTYRTREEVEENKKHDPLMIARQLVLEQNVLTEKDIEEMEARGIAIDHKIFDADRWET